MTAGMPAAPLAGLTVVSLEQAIAAPMCTRTLADLGARVIKVEHPDGGDFARHYDTVVNGLAAHFVWVNRGKESVTLDLKSPAGMAVLHRLLDAADVLVSNLAPGSTARLGIAPADLARDHPELIAVEIDGYGPGGTPATPARTSSRWGWVRPRSRRTGRTAPRTGGPWSSAPRTTASGSGWPAA